MVLDAEAVSALDVRLLVPEVRVLRRELWLGKAYMVCVCDDQ